MKKENKVNDIMKQLDEVKNDTYDVEDNKNPLKDATKGLEEALDNLSKNIKLNDRKPSKWPGYNPLKPEGWKEKGQRKIVKKTISKNEIKLHETQAPTQPEEVTIINSSEINNKSSRRKLPYNPLQPGAASEYMRRNKKEYNTVINKATPIKEEKTPEAKLAVEREELTDESLKVEVLNDTLQQPSKGNKSRILKQVKAIKRRVAKNVEPTKINVIEQSKDEEYDIFQDEDFTLEDIFKDNTIDSDSVIYKDNSVVDIAIDKEKDLINSKQAEKEDIYETNKEQHNKYKGHNPWIKKCVKEINKTDKQITALAIAKQFIDEKSHEIEGAKKVNVICSGDKYVIQVITGDKEVKTYQISEKEWVNRKKDEYVFKDKKPEYKKAIAIKKVLRVNKDKLTEEIDKLEDYKNGLSNMKDKLEPIDSKREWKTLGLTRKITKGEDKDKLEKEERYELKDIRHRVNDINKKFSVNKNKKHERNKDKIIDRYTKKEQQEMPPFGM